jgi:cell division protein FtsW (lipid II flippase)
MSLYSFAGYFFITEDLTPYLVYAIHAFVVTSLIVLYAFWHGKNWARIVVLGVSVFYVLILPMANTSAGRMLFACAILQAVWGAFLLYWLNTKKVREFFKPSADSKGAASP